MDYSQCRAGCTGLYADVDIANSTINKLTKDGDLLKLLMINYEKFKRSKIENFEIVGDRNAFQIVPKPYEPLHVVQIYFDSVTYDEIVKDVSVTLSDQLGAIGGTMGLFAGFSFLSALEIVYFVVKHLVSAITSRFRHICRVQEPDYGDMC